MLKKKKIAVVLALLAAALIFAVPVCIKYSRGSKAYETSGYAMGTYILQTVYGENGREASDKASEKIHNLENEISWRINSSEIAKLNKQAGKGSTAVDKETCSILETSLDVAEKSDGAFDPTILPVSSLWGFGGGKPHLPDENKIKSAVGLVGYAKLEIGADGRSASLASVGSGVDLGGIGKGAACDTAVAEYKKIGAKAGIVAAGGSIGVYGTKPDGSAWNIAVRDPDSTDDKSSAMGEINISSGFVSTSGPYEQYFVSNGKTYHHLLNPKTGYPENNDIISVTVTAENGALSDALSTACFVLGREKGSRLLEKYGAGGVFIDKAKKVYVTDNLKEKFKISEDGYKLAD
ncbi:MAG TPA: FAD:protein FMN transferase [Ruminococcaceae bacterium]|nr:FAD:protein FMN transferase [Oscillospiraceae bacterium]